MSARAYHMPDAQLTPDDPSDYAELAEEQFEAWLDHQTALARKAALQTEAAREAFIAARILELEREDQDAKTDSEISSWENRQAEGER